MKIFFILDKSVDCNSWHVFCALALSGCVVETRNNEWRLWLSEFQGPMAHGMTHRQRHYQDTLLYYCYYYKTNKKLLNKFYWLSSCRKPNQTKMTIKQQQQSVTSICWYTDYKLARPRIRNQYTPVYRLQIRQTQNKNWRMTSMIPTGYS